MKIEKGNVRMKEALQESDGQFRMLFDKIPDAVIIIDPKGKLLEANEMTYKLSGYKRSELLDKNIITGLGILDAKMKILVLKKLALHFSGREIQSFVIDIRRKDGKTIPLEVNPQIVDYRGKKADLIVLRDVTECKKVGQITNEAREYAESIVDTIREPLIVLDSSMKVISANRSFYDVFKVTPEETKGRLIYDLGNRQWNIPALRKLLEKILPKKNSFKDFEIKHDFETIGPKTMLLNARRIDSMQMILLAIEDVTERKRLENELLRVRGEEFRVVFDNAADGILIADLESKKFRDGNNAICRMLGYSAEEIKSLGVADIHPQKDLPYVIDQFERQIKGEFTLSRDLPVKRKDGSVFYADVNATIIKVAEKAYLMGFFHDTTERKKMEEDLRKRTEELERFNRLAVGRELRMIELKKRIKELEERSKKRELNRKRNDNNLKRRNMC